jgi:hypothetical protein
MLATCSFATLLLSQGGLKEALDVHTSTVWEYLVSQAKLKTRLNLLPSTVKHLAMEAASRWKKMKQIRMD